MRLLKDIIIAIDGYSSCGKSTLARNLAKCLGYRHIDTGAMYRAITLYCLENNYIKNNEINIDLLLPKLEQLNIDFKYNEKQGINEIYLNNRSVESLIREPVVSDHASIVSKIPQVRALLVRLQQKMGEKKRIVMDGRDIGTVVFPNADIKFFMTAKPEIRAQRRYKELVENGITISLDEVSKNIEERDYLDTHRSISPLVQANDAIVIDNSFLTKEQQFDQVLEVLKAKFPYEN
ncbi:MAG TPA: (d)CMP kinase [Bacteroidales bacterium]|jgi:cytidylate kinase|nr:(d)CMP kinase [Bacteroidales bacterium]HNV94884.1 (d)CMP kinase [Bacteroidales bacterium]